MMSKTRLASVAIWMCLLLAIVVAVFSSPLLGLGVVIGGWVIWAAFAHPLWVLAVLAWYFPIEPFLMKWVSEEAFIFVRFAPELLLYMVVAVACWKRWSSGRQWRTSMDVPFILFVGVLLVSSILNLLSPLPALIGARQILRFPVVFFAVVYLRPERNAMRWFTVSMFLMVVFQSLLGLTQAVVGEPLDAFLFPSEGRYLGDLTLAPNAFRFWDPGSRVFATFGRYDRLGTFLGFFLTLAVGALYELKQWRMRRELWLVFLLGFPALILTYSRSGWFGCLLGSLLIAWVIKQDHRVKMTMMAGVILLTSYLAVSGLVVNQLMDTPSQTVTERFFEAFSLTRWQGEYYGLGRMFWIVNTPLHVIPSAPLFGHGPGTFGGGAVSALRNTQVYDELGLPFGVAGTEGYIDNNWLSLWGETGTLGLVFYVWMMWLMFRAGWRLAHQGSDEFARAMGLGFCGVMIAVGVNAFLATFLEARTLAPYLWGYAGMIYVLAEKEGIRV